MSFIQKFILFSLLYFISSVAFAENSMPHSTLYTSKVRTLVEALSLLHFQTDTEYLTALKTSCERSQCNDIEKKGILLAGEEVIRCQITHLKSHSILNKDAVMICEFPQPILACDSLRTPLLRKMCYHGNNYSLQALQNKENHFKKSSRLPANSQ